MTNITTAIVTDKTLARAMFAVMTKQGCTRRQIMNAFQDDLGLSYYVSFVFYKMFTGDLPLAPAMSGEVSKWMRAREVFDRMTAKGSTRVDITKVFQDELGVTPISADVWYSTFANPTTE